MDWYRLYQRRVRELEEVFEEGFGSSFCMLGRYQTTPKELTTFIAQNELKYQMIPVGV